MKKILCVLLTAILVASSVSVSASALTAAESKNALDEAFNAMFLTVAGDVNNDKEFNALDARAALQASVGKISDYNATAADMDGDGAVTAIDARALLRYSANLDKMDSLYTAADKLNLFNALANNVKATGQEFNYSTMDQNINISYTNQKLVDKFNKQMNKLAGDGEKIDLGAELKKEKGKVIYKCLTGTRPATIYNYPVKEQSFVSNLTLKDIKSIEYNTNQTVTFAPKRTLGDGVKEESDYNLTMTGLDVVTVYLKNENIKVVPDDSTTLAHGRAFDVPQKDLLTSGYDEINNMFTGLEDYIGTMGAEFRSLSYHDSSISIYFDRETKKICAAVYNLYYDFTVTLDMDLYIFLIIDIDGAMDITDSEYTQTVYCFNKNYKSLGR